MRRDMDLIRELLLRLEGLPMRPGGFVSFDVSDPEFTIEGRSADEVWHHLAMIYDAGFAESGTDVRGDLSGSWYFRTLSWAGRDFLDAVREPKVWQETKSRASTIGGWTVGILRDLAVGLVKGEAAKHGFPMG